MKLEKELKTIKKQNKDISKEFEAIKKAQRTYNNDVRELKSKLKISERKKKEAQEDE